MADKTFAIRMQHRPRRVAFLIDMGQESISSILDAVLRFNLESWGGRHNPITPLVDNRIPEAFFPLLDVADPDVFYIYGELEPSELQEIHFRYSPTLVLHHELRPPMDAYSYGVRLREQATIARSVANLRSKLPPHMRRFDPSVLQFTPVQRRSLSRFFLWNVGDSDANFFAIQNNELSGCAPKSTSDRDVLELLASNTFLIWPIHVCGDAPLARTAGEPWQRDFHVFYGESPWNLVRYWNDGLTTGPTRVMNSGVRQLWITEAEMKDEATYYQLIRLLGQRVYIDGQQSGLRMISCDAYEAELNQVGQKLAKDMRGNVYYHGCEKFTPPYSPEVRSQRVRSFLPPPTDIEYASGDEVHVSLKLPSDVAEGTDQCWMVDVQISNPDHELWYQNGTPWWRLPRKSSIAGVFAHGRPQRVISDNRTSFEIDGRHPTLDFEIPSVGKLFRYLLSPQVHYHLAADSRSNLKESSYDIRLSDKGRYLSGILNLSKTLKETLYLYEHPFWRSLLRKLAERGASTQLTQKLISDVQDLLKDPWSKNASDAESWVTQELIFTSKQLSRAAVWLTFKEISELYEAYSQGAREEVDERGNVDLKSHLSDLTRDRILFQGVELRCPNCNSSYWYSVDEMRKTVTCRGCHVRFALQAEATWSYQLNELIRVGVGDQGLLPVFRTIARLFDRANDCFFFMPPVEFIAYSDEGERKVERELDLAWVKDGVFGIAEVKTTAKLFKPSDYEDMASLASDLRPDVVLIASPEGDGGQLSKGKKALEELLGPKFTIWAWGPDEFDLLPRWTTF